ncbi:MAG: exodeoxyribonuclease VII small subunit [Planctomycetota bacterium]
MAKRKTSKTAEQLEEEFRSLKYGDARQRLEQVLEDLEGEDVDLDDLSDQVRQAAALIRVLHEKLTRTQGEVEKIMDEVRQEAPRAGADAPKPEMESPL